MSTFTGKGDGDSRSPDFDRRGNNMDDINWGKDSAHAKRAAKERVKILAERKEEIAEEHADRASRK